MSQNNETTPAGKESRFRFPHPKRNQKLLFQVGVIFAIIFILIIGISAFIQVRGSTQTYLEAKQEFMQPLTEKYKKIYESLGNTRWFFDHWLEHPEIANMSIEDDTSAYKELVEAFPVDLDSEFEMPGYDPEKLDTYPEKLQKYLLIYTYEQIFMYQVASLFQMENETAMVIDIGEKNEGAVILDSEDLHGVMNEYVDPADFDFGLGEDLYMFLHSLTSIDKVRQTQKTVFERYENPKTGYYYYLCVSPIVSNGVVEGVYILIHDWSEFHSTLMTKLAMIVGFTGLVILAASILLLYFINRSAIRPLAKVQQGVREYMQTKNSGPVVEQMSRIRQKNEFGVLADDVSMMVTEIDRYTSEIESLTAERERVAAELALASSIQAGYLPVEFPNETDYEIYASMTPAKEVGGDLYDFFNIDETHVGLVIGDVSGKGVPASLFMMIAKLLIQEYAKLDPSPAKVLSAANETLCANNTNEMFVTVWLGILDRTTGKIIAASAGHEYPILKDSEDGFRLIKDRRGFVLGGMEMSKYKDYELELPPGGTLLVYTDGSAEATNAQEELFGTERMLEAMNKNKEDHPKEVIEHLTESINAFVGEAPQFDDLTMLCVRYNGR